MVAESEVARYRPLEDITVIDFTSALAGNFTTLVLGGLGAQIIKIERPNGGDGVRNNPPFLGPMGTSLHRETAEDVSIGFLARCRNKKSITLDLKKPGALDVVFDLVRHADAVMENFSRGTADRIGVGYEAVRKVKPSIVYCALSGYGQKGAPGTGKAMDGIIQAGSGVMMVSGEADDPPVRIGLPVADLTTPLFAVIAIISALHQVRRGGPGQYLDVSMLGVLTSLVSDEPYELLESFGLPMRSGTSVPRLSPFGVYRTSNGWVAISASRDDMFAEVMEAIGQPELVHDPRFAKKPDRALHYRELDERISAWTSGHSTCKVVDELTSRNVAVSAVRRPGEAETDPLLLERRDVVPLEHPTSGVGENVYGPGFPVNFSESEVGYDQPAPLLGQHNEEIYGGLIGYGAEKIKRLREAGVI